MGRKFTIFALFYFVKQIPSTSPPGGLYLEGRFNGEFFALRFWGALEGLIFGGAYTWRGLFSEFYGNRTLVTNSKWKILRVKLKCIYKGISPINTEWKFYFLLKGRRNFSTTWFISSDAIILKNLETHEQFWQEPIPTGFAPMIFQDVCGTPMRNSWSDMPYN